MKKFFIIIASVVLVFALASMLVGCGSTQIMVVSRESGSGTRSGFQEIAGLSDQEVKSSINCNSTNEVMTAVKNNKNAIGYISFGSLNNTVKAIQYDGVDCSVENVKNNSYKMSRPFIVVYKKGATMSPVAADFKKFLISKQAQTILSDNSYIPTSENAVEYASPATPISGELKISGSTSVNPVMLKLFAAYQKLNSAVTLQSTPNGSSAGITAAKEGTVDFGMSSRGIKTAELETVEEIKICLDAIAVIVNNNNALTNLSKENLVKIYKGEIKEFSKIA